MHDDGDFIFSRSFFFFFRKLRRFVMYRESKVSREICLFRKHIIIIYTIVLSNEFYCYLASCSSNSRFFARRFDTIFITLVSCNEGLDENSNLSVRSVAAAYRILRITLRDRLACGTSQ